MRPSNYLSVASSRTKGTLVPFRVDFFAFLRYIGFVILRGVVGKLRGNQSHKGGTER